jgi:apolipoprotein N-acyltransferase
MKFPKTSQFSILNSQFSIPIAALLTALAPAPIGLWGFAWVGLVPLWLQISKNRSPFRQGLLWGTIYHGISLFWITGLHPLTWMGIPFWNSVAIVAVIWIFITLWGAIGVGAWAWAVAWMAKRSFPSWTRILAATALWCGVETVRSYSILDWTNLAYTQSPGNLAILHLGQISGNALISATIVAFNFTLAEALRSKPRWKSFVPAIGILLISHIIGAILWLQPIDLASDSKPISIGIIQGNIPTRIKLSANGVRQGLRNYISGYETLTRQGAQLIIMPEGSMPFDWSTNPKNPLAETIQDLKTPIALGSFGTRGTRTTQSFLMLDDRARVTSQYDKIKVVPLGEALPFEDILGKFITRLSPLKSFLLAGADDQTFITPFGQAAIGICYESAFPEIFRRQVQTGSEFMITVSNLDPYSPVLMAQHEAHDLMRAVENSRYMARVTNTGYSGIITPHGEIKFRSSYQRTETHLGEIFRIQSTTLYTKFGNWITPGLMIASAIALLKFRKP